MESTMFPFGARENDAKAGSPYDIAVMCDKYNHILCVVAPSE